jgi:hypothetical protein
MSDIKSLQERIEALAHNKAHKQAMGILKLLPPYCGKVKIVDNTDHTEHVFYTTDVFSALAKTWEEQFFKAHLEKMTQSIVSAAGVATET